MKKIPNFNSLGCLIDRMTIERVKLEQIKLKDQTEENTNKALAQIEIIDALKEEFIDLMLKTWCYADYECIGEVRTFDFKKESV